MGSSQSSSSDAVDAATATTTLPSLFDLLNTQAPQIDWPAVQRLLQATPEYACAYAHNHEDSPLLVALQRQAPLTVVKLLVDAYPDVLCQADAYKLLPTVLRRYQAQTETQESCCEQVVAYLLQQRPALAKLPDAQGRLPLFVCVQTRNSSSSKIVRLLAQSFPESLHQRTFDQGNLALHHALLQQESQEHLPSASVLETLVELSLSTPQTNCKYGGLLVRNKRGITPIQIFSQVISKLLQQQPQQESNDSIMSYWKLLLHWTRTILKPYYGMELHSLLGHGLIASAEMLQFAMQQFPTQVLEQCPVLGQTPLHYACCASTCGRSNVPVSEILQVLLEAHPTSIRMCNAKGRLPIDLAAEHSLPEQCLELLCKSEPRAIDTRDLYSHQYPFQSAGSIATTYYLLRAKPHVLSYFHLP